MFIPGLDGGEVPALALLLIALLIDAYMGEIPWLTRTGRHPVQLVGRAIGFLDARLNRENRGDGARLARGFLTLAVLVAGAAGLGYGLAWLSAHHAFGWLIELPLVALLIAQRSLWEHVGAVADSLEAGGIEGGRQAVSMIVGRDPAQLDGHGVCRAAIESCAENFSDGVVAPVFWYVVAGLPGLLVYKTVNTLDSMIGHKTPRYEKFGKASARLDDLMNLIPARLAGLWIALAALVTPDGKALGALKTMVLDARKHRSPNAGWPEAAMAGALDLALAGPRRYAAQVVKDPWIGRGSARAEIGDIRGALRLYTTACMINAGAVGVVLWLTH